MWAWLLSLWSSLALFLTRRRMRDVAAYATAILLGFGGFFISLMVFYATPFATTSPAPAEGVGLDPLLRFPTMMIHPPMLYSGYTLCTIPLAFGMGALLARRVDAEWIRATRRFAFAAWLFLGVGILLGARWSYAELGWGGYWGWDAVENASLMPWLTGTAFLHSLMIQEKRGMLKVWNVSLVLATGTLAIMGTFLVRSGVLNSIHAFGGATLGVPFVVLIAVLIAGSIYLVVSRRDMLRSEHRLDSLLSRESIFLANNLVLVGLCFVIFWGTYFPLISEALTGREASVGPPWFDRYTVPLALVLVLLSGIGPVIAWRRATLANARRNFVAPAVVALVALVALLGAGVPEKPFAIAMFCCGAFVFGSIGQEFFRGVRARRAMAQEAAPVALLALVRRNRRRYGGYIVHIGMAVLFIGVAASSSFQHASELGLAGPVHARGRLHDPLRAPHGDDHAQVRRGPHGLDPQPRRGARRDQARTPRRHAAPERGLLRLRGSQPGIGRKPDRRPAGQPREHGRGRHARRVDRDPAEHRNPSPAEDREGRQSDAATGRGRGGDRLPGPRLPAASAAGAVPLHRLAARDVDLDRRPDRVRWRPDRDLAGAERRAPPRAACARAPAPRTAWRAPERGMARSCPRRPDRGLWMSVLVVVLTLLLVAVVVLVISAPLRAARRPPDPCVGTSATSSRRRARPSTARSATPSWTTARASSRARTTRPSTARCARKRSRSSTGSRARPRAS